jgi:hypothetical protein
MEFGEVLGRKVRRKDPILSVPGALAGCSRGGETREIAETRRIPARNA